MRNNTFWESASRPLFVRSVWLETAKSSRAPQRHFILDYEAQKKLKQRRQFSTPCDNEHLYRRKASFQHTLSYECSEAELLRNTENALAVASRKLQLQTPLIAAQTPKPKPKRVGPRRLTKLNLEKLEPHSSHNTRGRFSATSINNCLETPVISKRLAERVLNWLDLAVKGMSTEVAQFELDIEANHSPSAQRCSTAKVTANKPCAYTRWKKQEKLRQRNKHATTTAHEVTTNPTDVKCVSIVFDHARLVKTASCQPSQGTLKKLPMLETNMQKSADFRRLMRPLGLPLQLLETVPRNNNKMETTNTVDKPVSQHMNSATKKPLVPNNFLQDTRKQLHIFMPSLPDKPHTVEVGAPSLIVDFTSTVDSASALSFNESEI